MSRTRILLAAQPLDGGVARHVVDLAENLPRDRFTIAVACPRESLTWASLEQRRDVALHEIQPHRHPALGDGRSCLTLLRLVGRADVVHVHSAKAGFLGRLAAAARRRGGACVFTPHGWSFWAADGAERRLYLQLERLAARWCRTIVTLTAAERSAGLDARIGRPEQYRTIPNGVKLERYVRERAPVPGRILMVGRLAPPKRPDLALRALAELRARVPEAELDFVGDGPLRREAEHLAEELALHGAVRFLGSRDDVPPLLAEASCALLASDYEGGPLAVLEGFAAGVPVVATDIAAVQDLIEPGVTGLVAPHDDVPALAAALETVLRDPVHAAEIGAAGRREAEDRFALGRMVERLADLYEEGLEERNPG